MSLPQHGADPDLRGRDGGATAGDVALEKGHAEVYSLLMQHSIVRAADNVLEDVERRQQVWGRCGEGGGAGVWEGGKGEELVDTCATSLCL